MASLKLRVWQVLLEGPANTREITHRVGARPDAVKKCLQRMANAARLGPPSVGGRGRAAMWFLPDPTVPPCSHYSLGDRSKPSIEKKECATCGTTKKLLVHHIDGNHENNDPSNLKVLCSPCHSRLHGAQRREEREKHPTFSSPALHHIN